jgi:hypothetical protein
MIRNLCHEALLCTAWLSSAIAKDSDPLLTNDWAQVDHGQRLGFLVITLTWRAQRDCGTNS